MTPAGPSTKRRDGRGFPIADRLAERVIVDQSTGCHIWTGTVNHAGYGRISYEGRLQSTHRVAYVLKHSAIPDRLPLDHLCRNRACCNPDHLEPVTQAENVRRGDSGKRQAARTHCPQGHPYDEANTYRGPNGHRHCRACKAENQRKRARKAKAEARHDEY